jgi:hypothetical protein
MTRSGWYDWGISTKFGASGGIVSRTVVVVNARRELQMFDSARHFRHTWLVSDAMGVGIVDTGISIGFLGDESLDAR